MIFPSDNLPTSSKPWAREVTKQLSNVIDMTVSNDINNSARDNQLNSSVIAASAAATAASQAAKDAQDAIDGLISLSESGSGYSINADNLTAGTITGLTIQTEASGTRVVMGGSTIDVYYGSTHVGVLSGTNVYGAEVSLLSPGTPYGIYVEPTSVYLRGNGGFVFTGDNRTTINGGGGTIEVDATWVYMTKPLTVNAAAEVIGNFTAYGSNVAFPAITDSTAAANTRWGTTTGGRLFYSTASSQRYKEDIVDIETIENLDPKKLLDLPVRAFRYKADYQKNTEDSRYRTMIPGFIAEEVEQYYPLAADYEGEVVESWNERMIVPGLLALVKELYQRIEILEGK